MDRFRLETRPPPDNGSTNPNSVGETSCECGNKSTFRRQLINIPHEFSRSSGQDITEDARPFDTGEPSIEPLKFHAKGIVANAKLVQHRRVQIVHGADVL